MVAPLHWGDAKSQPDYLASYQSLSFGDPYNGSLPSTIQPGGFRRMRLVAVKGEDHQGLGAEWREKWGKDNTARCLEDVVDEVSIEKGEVVVA